MKYWAKTAKSESQIWRPLATKRGSLAVPVQRHVIASFISFLFLYGGFIQSVSNRRVIDDFLEKCTKISLKFGISAFEEGGQSKAVRVGLVFDIDSKNRIKN